MFLNRKIYLPFGLFAIIWTELAMDPIVDNFDNCLTDYIDLILVMTVYK